MNSPWLRTIQQRHLRALAATTTTGGTLLLFYSNNRTDSPSIRCQSPSNFNDRATITKAIPSRSEQLSNLKNTKNFDVLIVGGGATGSGAALDAVTRGLSTALIDRGDFGTETSSRSTKLVWAGIRYIATAVSSLLRWKNVTRPIDALKDCKGEFEMVLGAHKERRTMVENNPHLCNWVPIAIPFTSWLSYPPPFGHIVFSSAPIIMPLIMKFYDGMSGFTCPPSHIMDKKRALRKFPQLDSSEDVKYFQVFYEAQHNDARTNTCIALTAAEEGAVISNHTEMTGLVKDNNDKVIGITCRDNLSGETFEVYAKAIVFAGGPFTDSLRKLEDANAKRAVNAAAGTHIVLPSYYCPGGIGLLDINTSDGRFLFFLPWQGHTLVGTTDRKEPSPTSYHGPPEDEITWLLAEVQKYISKDVKVRRSDVLSAWQGYRPLGSDPNAPPGAPVSRNHIISTNPKTGITFVTGGKWTTYREMAEDVIDKVIDLHSLQPTKSKSSVTATMPLRGGVGYNRNLSVRLTQDFGVSEATANHLAKTYGVNAFDVCKMTEPTGKRWPRFGNTLVEGFPYVECEVAYACRNEMVVTLSDMLTLRMRIAYLNKEAALQIAPRVADLMAKELKWSRWERSKQLKQAKELISTFGGSIPNRTESTVLDVTTVRDVFSKLDMGGTKYIDLTEFMDACEMLGMPFKSLKEAKVAFDQIDLNGNGRIDENEFYTWWKKDSRLKSKLANKFKFTGEDVQSSGTAFG